jgi:predicted RNA binding protein with dsRBD fold (UPF0201 family)
LDGKKKFREVVLHEDDNLSAVLDALEIDDEEAQITCVAKRLVVKSSNEQAMKKILRQHGLMPAARIVMEVGTGTNTATSSLKGRAAEKKSLKKGSHTMQSIGVYAKDDNNKAELIDGGGGVWYEHDVSDDEIEADAEEESPADAKEASGEGDANEFDQENEENQD